MIHQASFTPAQLALLSSPDPYRTELAALAASFALTSEQRQHIAGLNDTCRRHEIGLLLYAHIYTETCRLRHVAVLSSPAERALQRDWQAQQAKLIDAAITNLLSEQLADARAQTPTASRARYQRLRRPRTSTITLRPTAAAGMSSARR